MNSMQQTLVDIYHPAFRKGYQDGRQRYFREQRMFTDKQLMESLESVFEPSEQEDAKEREEGVYYAVGERKAQIGNSEKCVDDGFTQARHNFLQTQ